MYETAKEKNRGKRRAKSHVVKNFEEGLAALENLEKDADAIVKKPSTARDFVNEAIDKILILRKKGVPIQKIFDEVKKAIGLRISKQTFVGYVAAAAKARTQNQAGLEPAPAWACSMCQKSSERREAPDGTGNIVAFWACPECSAGYFDDCGKMTTRRVSVPPKNSWIRKS